VQVKTVGLVVTVVLAILLAPFRADAQPLAKVLRIGWLGTKATAEALYLRDVFQHALHTLGWVEGHNFIMEYRWSEGQDERLPALAAELVQRQVDLILTTRGTPMALAAKHATTTIPIVFIGSADPVEAGLVDSLARPGGNLTGLASMTIELSGKRLELLKEAMPGLTRVAVLLRAANPFVPPALREVQGAAQALGVTLQMLDIHEPTGLDTAFEAMTREKAEALLVLADQMLFDHHTRIVDLAAQHRIPGMFWRREFAEAGGLMAYGLSIVDMFRRAAVLVDKILKGTKPADLPVERVMKFELVMNLKTARALGLTMPPHLLTLADEVIQ
jgi:putative ABC transport system substrate-binding protein